MISRSWAIILGVVIVICCISLVLCLATGILIFVANQALSGNQPWSVAITMSAGLKTPAVPTLTPPVIISSDTAGSLTTLQTLENAVIPENDLRDLAMRLQGIDNIPETVGAEGTLRQVGEIDQFWVTNTDTNKTIRINAVLRYVAEHVYFWVEEGVKYNEHDMVMLIDEFDQKIYERNREFFGSEWKPGIDNDPRLYILYAKGGGSVGGYFSSMDSVHPLVHKYSNAHELFFLSAEYVDLRDESAYGTLAHEFQHMIHWYRDRNEESWVNEGFSMLSEFINGYDVGYTDDAYMEQPDIQLTYWPSGYESYPHYGAAFLFMKYFLDRFGEDATKALVADPDNGLKSVDNVIHDQTMGNSKSGKSYLAEDLFVDWTITNLLNDARVADGRYAYRDFPKVPKTSVNDQVSCSEGVQNFSVHQFGVDYIDLKCNNKKAKFIFEGSNLVGVLPSDPHSGRFAFWSNRGDESDMTLTREFDFSSINGPVTLRYWAWYDIEKDYDYLYVLASEDGVHWRSLETPSGTGEDPTGNNYGFAYNGKSEGWIEEVVDLSEYSGKKIQIRFEYVTDAAVNGEGFLIDDIAIPEIGYSSDFEMDDGGWVSAGFVRIENTLPQKYAITIIAEGKITRVQSFQVMNGDQLEIPIDFEANNKITALVSGITRYTNQSAGYRLRLSEDN